ncbi:MAG: hypothetical protein AABX54_02075 [Nanoarchaeota archaeon]
MGNDSFERNIERALGEPIETTRARPIDVVADINAGRFGNPPQLAVGVYDQRTGKYTNNLRQVFPNPNQILDEALRVPWYERVLRFFHR